MTTRSQRGGTAAAVAVLLALAGGCATSDDPREGGLVGYWRHGDEGYRERLERRQDAVEATRQAADAEQAETERLQRQRDEAAAELAAQRGQLEELSAELAEVRAACAALEAERPDEAAAVTGQAEALQERVRGLEQDTGLLIRERQRRIADLQRELKLLRERASLLTTL